LYCVGTNTDRGCGTWEGSLCCMPGLLAHRGTGGIFEDTYNIIDIKNNKIHVDIKSVGGKKVPLEQIVKSFTD